MIYFDNAATTFPKPPQVISAIKRAVTEYGGNPGRAGHALSIKTAEKVFEAREKCAEFFGSEVENTIFTLNCTHALNTAIKGIAVPNAHYIISDLEHNAVVRPVHALSKSGGVTYSVAKTFCDDEKTVKSFESLINSRTKAIVCSCASNVTGQILPYKQIGRLCQRQGVCFILDAAQGAGVVPVKITDGINFICCSGHKGLYGPMGTGLLITDGKYKLKSFIEGGTGSNSRTPEQPYELPDRFESGTINTSGVIGLGKGIEFIEKLSLPRIHSHERELCEMFLNGIKGFNKIKLYFGSEGRLFASRLPLVPFNVAGMDSSQTAGLLSDAGFCLRGGLHCSPSAHKKMGTLDIGAVRFAPSAWNMKKEVSALIKQIGKIVE
jgi:cysteine desulfurase family protein